MNTEPRTMTIFLDIDGTIFRQEKSVQDQFRAWDRPELLEGVVEKFAEWVRAGHKIIVTTGREEWLRAYTEYQLFAAGLVYDLLIMNCGTGPRVVVNDLKPGRADAMARAVNVARNGGLKGVEI